MNEATGLTPFLVFMGQEAKLPADMILPNQHKDFKDQGAAVEHCLKNMGKIYTYLKGKVEIRIRRNSVRYANQLALNKDDIVWYLSSKNVPGKPLKVTKSWTGPWVINSRVSQVLYRIKPYDTSSPYPAITVHVGRLKKFTLDNTRRFMPPDLRTDPDAQPADPDIKAHLPPPDRMGRAPHQQEERIFIEPPEGWLAMDGEKRNQPPSTRQPFRGSRIDRLPLGPCPQPWQEIEEDLEYPGEQAAPLPDQDVWIDPEPGEQDEQMSLGSDQEPLEGSQEGSDVELEY